MNQHNVVYFCELPGVIDMTPTYKNHSNFDEGMTTTVICVHAGSDRQFPIYRHYALAKHDGRGRDLSRERYKA
jgi:hypothetical protein